MGKTKKIGIVIGAVLAIIIIGGAATVSQKPDTKTNNTSLPSSPKQQTTSVEPQQQQKNTTITTEQKSPAITPSTATKSISAADNILPTRQDISTVWRIGEITHDRAEGYRDYYQYIGIKDTAQNKYLANIKGSSYNVYLYVVDFDSSIHAKKLYDDELTAKRLEGGYTVYDTTFINNNTSNCYGIFTSSSFTGRLDIYCQKSNVYFHEMVIGDLNGMQYDDSIKKEIDSFAKITADKII